MDLNLLGGLNVVFFQKLGDRFVQRKVAATARVNSVWEILKYGIKELPWNHNKLF